MTFFLSATGCNTSCASNSVSPDTISEHVSSNARISSNTVTFSANSQADAGQKRGTLSNGAKYEEVAALRKGLEFVSFGRDKSYAQYTDENTSEKTLYEILGNTKQKEITKIKNTTGDYCIFNSGSDIYYAALGSTRFDARVEAGIWKYDKNDSKLKKVFSKPVDNIFLIRGTYYASGYVSGLSDNSSVKVPIYISKNGTDWEQFSSVENNWASDNTVSGIYGYPSDPNKLLVSTYNGLYISNDNGAKWEKIYNKFEITSGTINSNTGKYYFLTDENKGVHIFDGKNMLKVQAEIGTDIILNGLYTPIGELISDGDGGFFFAARSCNVNPDVSGPAVFCLSEDGKVSVKEKLPDEKANLVGCLDGKIYAYTYLSGKLIRF